MNLKGKKRIAPFALLMLLGASCANNEVPEQPAPDNGGEKPSTTFTINAGISDSSEPKGRATVDPQNGKSFKWQKGDKFDLYLSSDFSKKNVFAIDVASISTDGKSAKFTCTDFTKPEGDNAYLAFYPSEKFSYADGTFSFTIPSLSQAENNNTEHLKDAVAIMASGDNIENNILFKHKTALFRFGIANKGTEDLNVKSVELVSEANCFGTTYSYKTSDKKDSFGGATNTLVLNFVNSVSVNKSGDLKAYALSMPGESVGTKLTLVITKSDGSEVSVDIPVADKVSTFEAGKYYSFSFTYVNGALSFESLNVEDSWTEDKQENENPAAYYVLSGTDALSGVTVYKNDGTTELTKLGNDYLIPVGDPSFKFTVAKSTEDNKVMTSTSRMKVKRTVSEANVTYECSEVSSDVQFVLADEKVEQGYYYNSDGKCTQFPTYGEVQTIAIVFKVGMGEGDSKEDYDGKFADAEIKGYAIALKDASELVQWGPQEKIDGLVNGTPWGDFRYNGFQNTNVVKSLEGFGQDTYPAFYNAVNYDVTAPDASSGWYLPSIIQLHDAIVNLPNIETLLNDAGGSYFGQDYDARFWTSTQGEDNGTVKACYRHIIKNGNNDKWWHEKTNNGYVRSILTF